MWETRQEDKSLISITRRMAWGMQREEGKTYLDIVVLPAKENNPI